MDRFQHVKTQIVNAAEFQGSTGPTGPTIPAPVPVPTGPTGPVGSTQFLNRPAFEPVSTLRAVPCAIYGSMWSSMQVELQDYYSNLLKALYVNFQLSLFKKIDLQSFIQEQLKKKFQDKITQWLGRERCQVTQTESALYRIKQYLDTASWQQAGAIQMYLHVDEGYSKILEEHVQRLTRFIEEFVQSLATQHEQTALEFKNSLPSIADKIKNDPQWKKCSQVEQYATKLVEDNLRSRINLERMQQIAPGLLGNLDLSFSSLLAKGPDLIRRLISDQPIDLPALTPEACGNITQFEQTFREYQHSLRQLQETSEQLDAQYKAGLSKLESKWMTEQQVLNTWKAKFRALIEDTSIKQALATLSKDLEDKIYTKHAKTLKRLAQRLP
uniref:Uncharacterized protein n=1 Tax=viral metagenome TaxID=1070528 RepID=A0A6C0BQA3_9ZZZZ